MSTTYYSGITLTNDTTKEIDLADFTMSGDDILILEGWLSTNTDDVFLSFEHATDGIPSTWLAGTQVAIGADWGSATDVDTFGTNSNFTMVTESGHWIDDEVEISVATFHLQIYKPKIAAKSQYNCSVWYYFNQSPVVGRSGGFQSAATAITHLRMTAGGTAQLTGEIFPSVFSFPT